MLTKQSRWLLISEDSPLHINGFPVDFMKNIHFFSIHLVENLSWSLNTNSIESLTMLLLPATTKNKTHLPTNIVKHFLQSN